jgi:hypothetical protein
MTGLGPASLASRRGGLLIRDGGWVRNSLRGSSGTAGREAAARPCTGPGG